MKKPLPYTIYKSTIIKMYINQYTRKEIIDTTNSIIIKNRDLDEDKTPLVRKIRHVELMKIKEELGESTIYEF
ncbi:MAG: hypothetical protein HRT68_08625 [Flavobacteriaceae bacterium]|nr:hypothetical protein [Flavobacteriaceae bacterium]